MNHNPNNVTEGERVVLDKEFNNSSEVTIIHISFPQQLFTVVKNDNGYEWQTMTNRLSKIKPKEEKP